MKIMILLAALAACHRSTPVATQGATSDILPGSCFASCSSSLECRDVISNCRYCYLGKCSSVLPADPLDAGIDAAPGGTTP